MKILAVIVFIAVGAFIGLPLVKPSWDEFKAVEHDCANTKAEARTKEQQERCNRPATLLFGGTVIPGFL